MRENDRIRVRQPIGRTIQYPNTSARQLNDVACCSSGAAPEDVKRHALAHSNYAVHGVACKLGHAQGGRSIGSDSHVAGHIIGLAEGLADGLAEGLADGLAEGLVERTRGTRQGAQARLNVRRERDSVSRGHAVQRLRRTKQPYTVRITSHLD